jgi:hypothetical protein
MTTEETTPKRPRGRPYGSTKLAMAMRIDSSYAAAIEALGKLHGEHLAAFTKAVMARVKADREALMIVKGI